MNTAGIVLADNAARLLDELTEPRTLAAVPFGAKYRLIDFTLSNMVNAGISNVGVIMSGQYDSVIQHVQSGAEWDLDRKNSGLRYLPPLSVSGSHLAEGSRVQNLRNNEFYIRQLSEKYIILCGTGYVASLDFRELVDEHINKNADITVMFCSNVINGTPLYRKIGLVTDENGRILSIDTTKTKSLISELTMNTCVVEKTFLLELLESLDGNTFEVTPLQSLQELIRTKKVHAYFTDKQVIYLENLSEYLVGSLALLDPDVQRQFFNSDSGPVITKTKDSPATRYGREAKVMNSIIADGAVIEGEVRNSIIFRGVRVKSNAVIENSVVMQNSTVGEGARLNYAVLDKDVSIADGRLLAGYVTHPFFCSKMEII